MCKFRRYISVVFGMFFSARLFILTIIISIRKIILFLATTFIKTTWFAHSMQHKQKSRTLARTQVRTPAARVVTHHRQRKPSAPVCANCGTKLKGVPRGTPNQIKALTKSQRRPERPYGGVLCSACTRAKMKQAARQ